MLNKKSIREKIKIAREMVADEEEPYKTAAFQALFSKLLESEALFKDNTTTEPSGKTAKSRLVSKQVEKALLEKIDVNKLQYLKSLRSVHDKCLTLLSYVSKNIREYSGLTIDEMNEIFAEKFGLTTITENNISMSLKNVTGKYVTRNKISIKPVKYQYQILQKGMEYIEKKIAEIQKPKR